jgi:hypothetical protein
MERDDLEDMGNRWAAQDQQAYGAQGYEQQQAYDAPLRPTTWTPSLTSSDGSASCRPRVC